MKKFNSFLVLLLLMLASLAANAQNSPRGDVNCDGEVNIADVNATIDVILGGGSNTAADVNNDGEINIADVNVIISIILDGPGHTEEVGDWVDLGLPSGTIWATRNVGATNPEDYGDYFAWGETKPKNYYENVNYVWYFGYYDMDGEWHAAGLTKYCTVSYYGVLDFVDNKTELDPSDDAACIHYPGGRMPSLEQIQELRDNCYWQWTQRKGVMGHLVIGPNGNSIFLPASGYQWGESLYGAGSNGYFWSRTLYSSYPEYAYRMYFDSGNVSLKSSSRVVGVAVRAVRFPYDNEGNEDNEVGDWVDLGLPSGTIWATRNVGATNPEDYGDYFAWGETEPKYFYILNTYKWYRSDNNYSGYTKYCTVNYFGYNGFTDDKTELDLSDDAAWIHYPDGRMPSLEQIEELRDNCYWLWTQRKGVMGRLVIGPNGNSIFLPASGDVDWSQVGGDGIWGFYWSRTLYSANADNAYDLGFSSSSWAYRDIGRRYYGKTVRAVHVQ